MLILSLKSLLDYIKSCNTLLLTTVTFNTKLEINKKRPLSFTLCSQFTFLLKHKHKAQNMNQFYQTIDARSCNRSRS